MKPNTAAFSRWEPPPSWRRLCAVDVHAAGEPLRVIVDGYPEIPGHTMLERRAYLRKHLDHLRTALMWEPRGHADMYGCVLTPPATEGADFGVLFLHNEGYSSMCGHGILAVMTALAQTGALDPEACARGVVIDTPAGQVRARARVREGCVRTAAFENVPSFVVGLDRRVDVPGIGPVRYDLAFGGAYYALVDATPFALQLDGAAVRELIDLSGRIKRAVAAADTIEHPFDADLGFLYGVIWTGPPHGEADTRNVCVFADGEVDRSPTGTGVSSRLAVEFARGAIGIGDDFVVESVIGSTFKGRVLQTTRFGPYDAIVPEVEGRAHLTGRLEFWIDPEDPLRTGFLVR